MMRLNYLALSLTVLLVACGAESGDSKTVGVPEALPIANRYVTVVAETCSLDAWQKSTLQAPAAKRFVKEVILVCPSIRATGEVYPSDPEARDALRASVSTLRSLGYKAKIAVTMGDDRATFPQPYPPPRTEAAFGDAKWRASVMTNLAPFAAMGDGLEIDLVGVPNSIRSTLTQFFVDLDATFRKTTKLAIMAPPSTRTPSDTPGGDAFDLAAISQHVDRVRMMTLDFSGSGTPGPDIDSGWAVDAGRFARTQVRAGVGVDIAFPLYGTDFSDLGTRFVSYDEGRAMAVNLRADIARDPGGELNMNWTDTTGRQHHTWFEDATAASRTLHAWDEQTLPLDVGVVLYGIGAEDPALWDTLARGLP